MQRTYFANTQLFDCVWKCRIFFSSVGRRHLHHQGLLFTYPLTYIVLSIYLHSSRSTLYVEHLPNLNTIYTSSFSISIFIYVLYMNLQPGSVILYFCSKCVLTNGSGYLTSLTLNNGYGYVISLTLTNGSGYLIHISYSNKRLRQPHIYHTYLLLLIKRPLLYRNIF